MITATSFEGGAAAAPAVMPKWPVTLDTKGRVHTCPEQRRALLAEFARSGWSAARFAQSVGLKYSTFVAWVARDRRPKRPASRSPLRLVDVTSFFLIVLRPEL